MPEHGDVVRLEELMHALTDADQSVFVAALMKRSFKFSAQHQRQGSVRLAPWYSCCGEGPDPCESVQVSESKVERLTTSHAQACDRAPFTIRIDGVLPLNRRNHIVQQISLEGCKGWGCGENISSARSFF